MLGKPREEEQHPIIFGGNVGTLGRPVEQEKGRRHFLLEDRRKKGKKPVYIIISSTGEKGPPG